MLCQTEIEWKNNSYRASDELKQKLKKYNFLRLKTPPRAKVTRTIATWKAWQALFEGEKEKKRQDKARTSV